LFAVARDGMLPYSLSVIHPFFKAPVRAIVIGQGFGLIVTCLIGALWGATKGSNICVITSLFAAMCSYLIQMHCFLRARRTPSSAQAGADPGPLMSPLGAPGAYLAMTLVAGVLCCLVYLVTSSSDYRLGLVSIFALGIVIVTTMQAVSARPNSGLVTTGAQRVIV
jgi:amino acid transporter